jgi:hypothetical protein
MVWLRVYGRLDHVEHPGILDMEITDPGVLLARA